MKKKIEIEKIYPLSPMQEGMLFHALMHGGSHAYFEQNILEIKGEINPFLFEKSINLLIDGYDVLRTIFRWEKVKQPLQIVLKQRRLRLHVEDISSRDEKGREQYLEEFLKKDRQKGFDLSKDLLTRVSLLKTGEKSHVLVWDFHHILMDGWCLAIIYKDLTRVYHALENRREIKPQPPLQYKYYIDWLEKQDKEEGLRYWEDYLTGCEEPVTLPKWGKPLNKNNEYRLNQHTCTFDETLTGELNKIVKENRVTLNTLFQTLWGILLQKYNNTRDVVFGAVVSGRPPDIDGIEDMVGLFINTVPVRITTGVGVSFARLLSEVQQKEIRSKHYEYLPLAEIQSRSSLKRNLIDHIIAFENYPFQEVVNEPEPAAAGTGNPGFYIANMNLYEQTGYDIDILVGTGRFLTVKFTFNSLIYGPDVIERTARHLLHLAHQAAENPYRDVRRLEIGTAAEKQQLLVDFNNTAADFPAHRTVHELFEQQVQRMGDGAAVIGGAQSAERMASVSYKELNIQSNRLAHLLKEKGVMSDTIVGIEVERSVEMIIGIFGILKAGGAYLPIDPNYPEERKQYMLKDSGTEILLTVNTLNKSFLGVRTGGAIFQKSPLAAGGNLAYIIYTSGSTGRPKGVMVEHRSVVNLLSALQKQYPFSQSDTYLLKTSYIFDVSVTELFGWFLEGGKLAVLQKDAEKEPAKILHTIQRDCVSHINFVPSMFNVFTDELTPGNISQLAGLRYIFLAGEELPPGLADKFKRLNTRIVLENIYGPTESTVYACKYPLSSWSGAGSIPIGKPLQNTGLYIMDKDNCLQPIGVPGELCISGIGLARGYLNNPELTAKKFLTAKTREGTRRVNMSHMSYLSYIYKTGDLCRWLPDGNIEFLGRQDRQVKIRGFRIELGEIESRLLSREEIKEAVVVIRERKNGEGDFYLCAYIVTQGMAQGAGSEGANGLREYLSLSLPDYMIPAHFVKIEKIPSTPGGKIDRSALPEPETVSPGQYAAPGNKIEKELVETWSGVLSIPRSSIGIDDNFFELGGHSLNALRLIAKIHKALDVKLQLGKLFKIPTIRGLAEYITKTAKNKYISIRAVEKKEYYVLSSAQKRLYILQQLDPAGTAYNMPEVIPLAGEPDGKQLEKIFKKLIQRHESLRTSFLMVDGQPVQRIHDEVEFKIKHITNHHSFILSFDLSAAPLLRVGLIKTAEGENFLLLDMHHIMSDGVSHQVLVKDFSTLGRGEELSPLRIQYKDFSQWQNSEKQKENIKQQETYWLGEFAGEIPVPDIPTDYERPETQSFAGSVLSFSLAKGAEEALKRLASEEEVTVYMVFLALYNVLLGRMRRQEDIVLGTPVAGRGHADLEGVIGMFVNTLALRNYPQKNKSFKDFLKEVKTRTLAAFENQAYPFEDLVEKVVVHHDRGRNPLFDIMFSFMETDEGRGGEQKGAAGYENILGSSKFDMTLTVYKTGEEGFYFDVRYCTRLFKEETIKKFINSFKMLAANVIENPDRKISEIEMVSQSEKVKINVDSSIDLEEE